MGGTTSYRPLKKKPLINNPFWSTTISANLQILRSWWVLKLHPEILGQLPLAVHVDSA